MADSCTENLVLPIGVSTIIITVINIVCPYIATDVIGCCHVELLRDHVESHITIIGHISALTLISTLCGNDNHTVGSLRTVDGCSRSITKHVDTLDIIRSYH